MIPSAMKGAMLVFIAVALLGSTGATHASRIAQPGPTISANLGFLSHLCRAFGLCETADNAALLPSADLFDNAVVSAGFPRPSKEVYGGFQKTFHAAGFRSEREVAMFLAQILHESGGLKYIREINPPASAYDHNSKGVQFYGRGYIQLTWAANYKAASKALLGNEMVLYDDPNRVVRDQSLAWGVSFWYWKANVIGNKNFGPQVLQGKFGAATNAINGALECHGKNMQQAKDRFDIYRKVLPALGVKEAPHETGCYN